MEEMKNCPYCGEEINVSAKKCKHCGEWLSKQEEPVKTTPAPSPEEEKTVFEKMGDWVTKSGYTLLIIGAIAVFAMKTVPDEQAHLEAVEEGVIECVNEQTGEITKLLGVSELDGVTSMYFKSEEGQAAIKETFHAQNELVFYRYWLMSITEVVNTLHPDGEPVSIGMFGMVLPMVFWEDFKFDLE